MKIARRFYSVTVLIVLFFVLWACQKAAKTVEYYDTHEKERTARIEECKKMNPADSQDNKDCQAAIRSWSIADNNRVMQNIRNMPDPARRAPQGNGFIKFGGKQ